MFPLSLLLVAANVISQVCIVDVARHDQTWEQFCHVILVSFDIFLENRLNQ